jgi:hypothetical protein
LILPLASGVEVVEGLPVGETTTSGPAGVKVRLPVGVGVLVAEAMGVSVWVGVLVAGPGVFVRVGVLVGPEGVVAVGVGVRVGVAVGASTVNEPWANVVSRSLAPGSTTVTLLNVNIVAAGAALGRTSKITLATMPSGITL